MFTLEELRLLEEVILFALGKTHTERMEKKVREAKRLIERDIKLKITDPSTGKSLENRNFFRLEDE